jgi:RNA polymerase sigma factor (sigma-70 family)
LLFDDEELCQPILRELARRGWKLAFEPALFGPDDAFCARVKARLLEWCNRQRRLPDDALVRQAMVHEYCHLLHAAVSRDDGRLQSMALNETIVYGWPLALKQYHERDLAESAVLRAVHKTWLTIERCQPGSYLAYFTSILLREIGQERRKQKPIGEHETTESDMADLQKDDAESPLLSFTDPAAQAAFDLVLNRESMSALLQVLRDCLENVRQEHIILLHFFAELNPSEIAGQLRMRVNQYYVEKSRALNRIRECCREEVARELQLRLAPSF